MASNTEIFEAVVRIEGKLADVAEEVACMRGKWSMAKWMIGLLWPLVTGIIIYLIAV